MKKIEIHEDAFKNFNYKINCLSALFELRIEHKIESKFKPQIYDLKEIDGKQIVEDIIKRSINEGGSEVSRSFLTVKGSVGLFDLNYIEFEKICAGIQKMPALINTISLNTIKEIVFKWLINNFKENNSVEPMKFLKAECQNKIEEWEIVTPIAELYIENEFSIGNINLITLSKEIIDGWESSKEDIKKTANIVVNGEQSNSYEELRKSYCGKAAAKYSIEAELNRAIEMANEETDISLSILRYFSRANVIPNLISCCTISGAENINVIKNLIIRNNLLSINHIAINRNYIRNWIIQKDDLELFKKMGLNKLSNLLKKETLSKFESTLLDSLLIYSRNSLMQNIHDKIIYILSSLEAILIIDNNESIMQNLSERIAILIGKNVEEKKQIIRNIKTIYGLRSKFLHHGNQDLKISQNEDVRKFLEIVHTLYAHLIGNIGYFKTKEHLIEFILEKKLSN